MGAGGWIGVDLDGTLAMYDWEADPSHIGPPVPKMVARVHDWLARGQEVRIFTARVSSVAKNPAGQRLAIQIWCDQHLGTRLKVTAEKDYNMRELWDDRCVQVQPNTGEPIHEFWRHVQ